MNIFLGFSRRLMLILAISLTAFVTACGGGGVSGPGPTLSGNVVKGPVSGAAVNLFVLNNDGSKGATLGTATTNTEGNFSMPLSATPTTPVLVEASGVSGSGYVDEATGVTTALATTDLLSAVLPVGTTSASVTPLTHIAASRARELARTGAKTDAALAASIGTANAAIAIQYGIDNIITTVPVAATTKASATASTMQRQYGVVLAGLAEQANTLGVRPIDLMYALASDAKDGTFNGTDSSTGTAVPISMLAIGSSTPVMLPAAAGVADMQTAIDKFINNSMFNKSGTTPVTIVATPVPVGSNVPFQKSDKAMTTFVIANVTGTINEAEKTIAVSVSAGTDVTALVATFMSTGANVTVGPAPQSSRITANNFTKPVIYTVAAADGTTASYSVTVTAGAGPSAVNLRTVGNFAIFSNTGISNATFGTAVTGNIGTGPGVTSTAITGFSLILPAASAFSTSAQVVAPFKVYAYDYALSTPNNMITASNDMSAAYNDATSRPAAAGAPFLNLGAGDIVGKTLAPGLYTWGSDVSVLSGSTTLSGGPNDVWIFQIAGKLTMGANTRINLSGGALAKNIFWQVAGSSVTLGAGAHLEGIVLSKFAINFGNQASASGRLLAQTAVNLDQNAVTQPAQ